MLKRRTFEVRFSLVQGAPVAREILKGVLVSCGVDPCVCVDKENKKGFSSSVFYKDEVMARALVVVFRRKKVRGVRVAVKVHREKDWSSRWKKGWKPFRLTPTLCLVPLWQKDRKIPRGMSPVYLETTNAFGTGRHETTKFSAQLIERLKGEVGSFLDIGTGSGILLVVARRAGAKVLEGFDIDPVAVEVAATNLCVNDVRDANVYAADIGTLKGNRTFDLVAANLVTQDLIRFQKSIIACVSPGGHLVVSGISLSNLALFRRKFNQKDLRCVRVIRGREWTALLFQKKVRS